MVISDIPREEIQGFKGSDDAENYILLFSKPTTKPDSIAGSEYVQSYSGTRSVARLCSLNFHIIRRSSALCICRERTGIVSH